MAKTKFYAVRRGREGPKIYDNWSEVRLQDTDRIHSD
jgi:viroplasmin and RNaseH domain-containing protein